MGLHLDGVNHLKELLEHEESGLVGGTGQVEESLKDLIKNLASGWIAIFAYNFAQE